MRILEHFAKVEDLPITLDEVADFILAQGYVQKISFVEEAPENKSLIGLLYCTSYKPPYAGEAYTKAHVVYDPAQSDYMERLVCAKELIHITDGDEQSATKRDEVDRLLSDLSLPGPVRAETLQFRPGLSDRVGLLRAAALLAPFPLVKMAKEAIVANQFSAPEFASLAQIPSHIAKLVLSDEWPMLLVAIETADPVKK